MLQRDNKTPSGLEVPSTQRTAEPLWRNTRQEKTSCTGLPLISLEPACLGRLEELPHIGVVVLQHHRHALHRTLIAILERAAADAGIGHMVSHAATTQQHTR